ncbi:MAG: RIP metalloprotease RseP [Dehalococcoidales bacterium]|nr:RIP metalloprotease RseP [Dehalococcoidales bacterium]
MLITLVTFFLILIVLILAHELGHFFTAKLFKVKVEEFGIFMPPRIFAFKKGETVYSLNAIPLGGFNKLAGEVDPAVPGSLAGKSIPVRLLVLSAGSLMNIILPLILLSIAYMIPHLESVNNIMTDKGEVFVAEVVANSPSSQAGIKVNDIILSANGEAVLNVGDYERIIKANLDNEITVNIKHPNGDTENVKLTPQANAPVNQGATGVAITTVVRKSYPFWEAIPQGAIGYWDILLLFKDGISGMISGAVPVEVTGPVGLAQMTGEVVKTGFANLLRFAAIISLNLGILNIFPIPAMDGGRIVFVLLEWVRRGKRVSPKTEGMIHTIGFILLMVVFVVVAYRDIVRIISGGSLG